MRGFSKRNPNYATLSRWRDLAKRVQVHDETGSNSAWFGAGVTTDTTDPVWSEQPATRTAPSAIRARAAFVRSVVGEHRGEIIGISVIEGGFGVAGAERIGAAEVRPLPIAADVTAVHDAVAGVHGLREGCSGFAADGALHR